MEGQYADPELSGYRRDRPELLRLLTKKLRFDRVRLVIATEGEIDDVSSWSPVCLAQCFSPISYGRRFGA